MLRARKLVGVRFKNTDGSLPQLGGPDPILKTGSMFLFDFRKKSCWPSQLKPAAEAQITNLVKNADGTSAPPAIVKGINMNFANGGMVFPGASNSCITLGDTYNQAGKASPSFVISVFLKIDSSKTDAYQRIFGIGTSTNKGLDTTVQFNMDSGVVGSKKPRASVGSASATVDPITSETTAEIALDTTIQLAMSYVNKRVRIFVNGVFVFSRGVDLAAPLADPLLRELYLGNSNWKGTMFRIYGEDLSVSGATDTAVVAAEYAANKDTF